MFSRAVETELIKRSEEIRRELIKMFSFGTAHHYGGCLSCVEIMTSLFFYKMHFSFANREHPNRDRFIMSKGHSIPVQYVILSMLGFFPMEELKTIKKLHSRLQGHPDINKTPGIEAPTGSLGQGLSYANGIALAGKFDENTFRVFVLAGDGEIQEGQIWEAAMATAHYNLKNVCLIIDRNKYQSQGMVDEMMSIEPLEDKFKAFGWKAVRVNGHNIRELCAALDSLDNEDHPGVIIADTVKGKGVHFMEDTYKFHNYALSEEEYSIVLKKLSSDGLMGV
ncbi:MAG: transketolase [Spirochaetales bacterium]|nr:transketolase [Spirochaetales bacterium]